MKIGVGVITMGVREIKDYKLADGVDFRVFTDTEKKGPGYARNLALKEFYDSGCDYIFVFDDDCYPRMHGWEEYFINQSELSGIKIFGMPEHFKSDLIHKFPDSEVCLWKNMMLLQFGMYTRECIEKIGYFDYRFGRYGLEDDLYLRRASWAGLTNCGDDSLLASPFRVLSYICSDDVFQNGNKKNMSDEEKKPYIDFALSIHEKIKAERKIFIPFNQDESTLI